MKKIYFKYVSRNYLSWLAFVPVSVFFLLSFEELGGYAYLLLLLTGTFILLNSLPLTDYIKYNKNTIYLKIRDAKARRIQIKEIAEIKFFKSCLIIRLYSGNSFVFNLKHIHDESVRDLRNFFEQMLVKIDEIV